MDKIRQQNNVKIRVKTSQFMEGGEEQIIDSYYTGTRIDKEKRINIKYSEYDTIDDRQNTIEIGKDDVYIIKSGDMKYISKYREGVLSKGKLRTPYGVLDMSVYTYSISKRISKDEIRLNLDYKMTIEGISANNRVEIKVTSE